ncbi:alpha/beta hydrolase [Actinosynnema pretiosum]|uniref:Alpha/beta hydrolase n=1 Tax=Actinosynnema pretiosum TaxID=42197 RepID=A0A290ZAG7_9PSEU|nr:alpha/beta hydrolase [Actinosynnema pretiosum]
MARRRGIPGWWAGPVTEPTTFVLVHGAWHGAAQWGPTRRALARLGAHSAAVDLPGHGLGAPLPSGYLLPGQPGLTTEPSAVAGLSAQDSADAVLDALAAARRHGRVVLVAHSAGGGPASLAAERAPALVDRLVYLTAFVPARPRFTDYTATPENAAALSGALRVGDPDRVGAFRINPLSTDKSYVDALREAFCGDLDEREFGPWRLALTPDEQLASLQAPVPVTARRWGSVPRAFLRCADDRALTAAAQDLMIREADEAFPEHPFAVRTLPGGHSPFATRPEELARHLVDLA